MLTPFFYYVITVIISFQDLIISLVPHITVESSAAEPHKIQLFRDQSFYADGGNKLTYAYIRKCKECSLNGDLIAF